MQDSTIDVLGRGAILDRVPEFQATYERMYGIAEYSAEFVPAMLELHSQRPGFRLCAASAADGSMIGFAYGFTGLPGQAWRDRMAEAVGEELAGKWMNGHFEFAEFGVVPEERRQGVGTRLYDQLFGGVANPHALLTVVTHNEPALEFYRSTGWELLLDHFEVPGHGPYKILLNPLHS